MDQLAESILLLKNENAELKKELDFLKSNSTNNKPIYDTFSRSVGFDLAREMQDRDTKSRNILIFNVREYTNDIRALVDNMLKSLKSNLPVTSVDRLGKIGDRPRSIRIVFESPNSVFSILKSKKILFNNPLRKDMWISTDLTPYQRHFLSTIKVERDRRNNSELKWRIIYKRGSPVLVQKN